MRVVPWRRGGTRLLGFGKETYQNKAREVELLKGLSYFRQFSCSVKMPELSTEDGVFIISGTCAAIYIAVVVARCNGEVIVLAYLGNQCRKFHAAG
jgi:hypothetical protein